MITKNVDIDDAGKRHAVFLGLSTDDKATCDDPRNGDLFLEMDTKAWYAYDQASAKWWPQ